MLNAWYVGVWPLQTSFGDSANTSMVQGELKNAYIFAAYVHYPVVETGASRAVQEAPGTEVADCSFSRPAVEGLQVVEHCILIDLLTGLA